MNEWISVKDRLPEESGLYLCAFDDGFVASIVWEDDWALWQDSGEVTHWMVLPDPPMEAQHEED